jgi:DNA-binding HxlR family transcriptional regulator
MRNMILLKQNRFNQFLNSVEGINAKTLAIRLQQLEEYGLVERKEMYVSNVSKNNASTATSVHIGICESSCRKFRDMDM